MKKTIKLHILTWIFALLPLISLVFLYPLLPARLPMHWDIHGAVTYENKTSIWLLALMGPFFSLLTWILPHIDPQKRNYRKFSNSYQFFRLVLVLFTASMYLIILTETFRPGTIHVSMLVSALISLLLVIIGNIMPKFRQNFFCGIKSPWTLSSKAVWEKTHRLGGRLFFFTGILLLLLIWLPPQIYYFLFLGLVLFDAMLAMIMSFIWYQKEHRAE